MAKCQGYGTVRGCGTCIINLRLNEDIGPLDVLALITICISLLSNGTDTRCLMNIRSAEITCNGIVRLIEHSENKADYMSPPELLSNWLVLQVFETRISRNVGNIVNMFIDKTSTDTNITRKGMIQILEGIMSEIYTMQYSIPDEDNT